MRRLTLAVILLFVAVPTSTAAAAPSAHDAAMLFHTAATIYEAAEGIETLRSEKGSMPKLAGIADLSRARFGNEAWEEGLIDAWGTPLHIETDVAKNTYLIVAAGSDRTFQRSTWTSSAQLRTSADDIVFRDGAFTRSSLDWAEAAVTAAGSVELAERALDHSRHRRTTAALRSISSATDTYSIDHNVLPRVSSVDELAKHLVPKYMSEVPKTDGWGTPLRVRLASPTAYIVASAGPDKRFATQDDIIMAGSKFMQNEEPRPAASPQTGSDDEKAASTMASFKALANAMEKYRDQNGWRQVKATTLDELTKALVPKYAASVPKTDAWGTPLRIDNKSGELMIVSAGSDRKFDERRWKEEIITADYTRDLRIRDSRVEASWDTRAPADRLADAWGGYVVARSRFKKRA